LERYWINEFGKLHKKFELMLVALRLNRRCISLPNSNGGQLFYSTTGSY